MKFDYHVVHSDGKLSVGSGRKFRTYICPQNLKILYGGFIERILLLRLI